MIDDSDDDDEDDVYCRLRRDLYTMYLVAWRLGWSGCIRTCSKTRWNNVRRRSGRQCCTPLPFFTWRCENEACSVLQLGTGLTTAHWRILAALSDVCRITSTASNAQR